MPRIPEQVAQRVAGVVWAGLWLWPLITPAMSIMSGRTHPTLPAAAGLGAFVVTYLAVVVQAFARDGLPPTRTQLAGLALVAVLGVATAAAYGRITPGWHSTLLYVGAAGAATLAAPAFYLWTLGTVGTLILISALHGTNAGAISGDAFSTLMACALVFSMARMAGYIRQLHDTQAALARSAVEQERLRFSRDLHDLLGHTLSLVVVKAEVVRRLIPRDPDAAASQAADIEEIGRKALTEVREAVSGYRDRAFAAELDDARTALTDAGIAVTIREVGTPLPPEVDALFAWTVREAVTNVIRHSRAQRCEISVDSCSLEIRDDGVGPARTAPGTGNGLRGLTERLVAVGGELRTEAAPGGGFRVLATAPAPLPLAADA